MTRSKKEERARSYMTGEKGTNRVRLFERSLNGKLFLEYRGESGKKERIALGHSDFTRGKEAADTLAAELRKGQTPRSGDLTLKVLFDNYEREVTPKKTPGVQKHDRLARRLFEQCWGPDANVKDLHKRDWDHFIAQRRSGELKPDGGNRIQQGVRNRMIEYDLKFLLAVCNWATTVRLCERNPFKGYAIPTEKNPERPITTEDEFQKLHDAAKALGPEIELYLLLVHETGHRCTAVGRLRWSDVDFSNTEQPKLRWRPEHDKIGMDHTVPISAEAAETLLQARRRSARIGDAWIFTSPTDPEQPIRRDLLRDWWLKLETQAGLPHVKGRGWHSLRRKFATDLKHDTPLADLCFLGGWKDPQTVIRCYMRPDEATMRSALLKRASTRVVGQ